MAFKWKRDKENNATVKIISEAGDEIGELRFNFNNKKERE
jgi:hypothetical protein